MNQPDSTDPAQPHPGQDEPGQNEPGQNKPSPAQSGGTLPEVVQKVDQQQLQHFVTAIKTAEQQVGENIIRALSHDNTVAVLTTVMMGPQGQQIVSAALNPQMMQQVQQLLMTAQKERKQEEPCMGFHCFIEPADADDEQANDQQANDQQANDKPSDS